jgi:hypothetical protein
MNDKNVNLWKLSSFVTPERFLYVDWNSEYGVKPGGGGIGHVIYTIKNLILLCLFEGKGRTLILSDEWRMDTRHSPESPLVIRDIRKYFEFPFKIETSSASSINIVFDEGKQFYNTFNTWEPIGIAERSPNIGCSRIRTICNNITKKFHLETDELLHLPYIFFCGTFFKKCFYNKSEGNRITDVILLNYDLLNKAKDIFQKIVQIYKQHSFYCLHLRRGDQLHIDAISKASDVEYVLTTLQQQIPKKSIIYLMTNGTADYVYQIQHLLSSHFTVLTKSTFNELAELGINDNYELYLVEQEIAKMSTRLFTNRIFSAHTNKMFSLIYNLQNR